MPQGWQVEVRLLLALVAQARSLVAQPVLVGKVVLMQHGSPAFPQVHRPDVHVP